MTSSKKLIIIIISLSVIIVVGVVLCFALIPKQNQNTDQAVQTNLNQEYKTEVCKKQMVAGPTFFFNYNDNWVLKKNDIVANSDIFRESVELTNKNNSAKIDFVYCTDTGGGTEQITDYAVLKKCENFKGEDLDAKDNVFFQSVKSSPNFPYSKDYNKASDLEVWVTKTTFPDNRIMYCVQDKKATEKQEQNKSQAVSRHDFGYYGTVSFQCSVKGAALSAQDEQEVVDILASLRTQKTEVSQDDYAKLVVGSYNCASPSSSLRMWLKVNADGTATFSSSSGAEHFETDTITGTYKVTNTPQTFQNNLVGNYVEIMVTPSDGKEPLYYTYIVSGDYILDQKVADIDAYQMQCAREGYKFNRDK